MRALIVDSSKPSRSGIGGILAATGFAVFEADDSSNALDLLDEIGPVDLVLVDWELPEAGGLRLVLGLRAERDFDATRLIMLTSEPHTAEILEAIRIGVDECLVKPFSKRQFLDKLAQLRLNPA